MSLKRLRERLLGAMDVRGGEESATALMLAHSFAMGIATTFFENAANALFLAKFEVRYLAWVYIGAAIVTTLTGILYTRLKERLSFGALMIATLIFLLVLVVGSQVGLWMTEAAIFMFGLLIVDRILSVLTDLEYWAVASRLFDVRQAKRLYGLVGTGEVGARVVGSLAVPFFVSTLGVKNLMTVSAAGLVFCLIFLVTVLRRFKKEMKSDSKPKDGGEQEGLHQLRDLLRNRYLMLLFTLISFGILGKYFVDFAFRGVSRARYTDAAALAIFFANFNVVTQVVNLLIRVFISGKILSRFGIRIGLLILPAAHLLCTLGVVVVGLVMAPGPAQIAMMFWFVVANQGAYKTLKHPIDNPSFKVLYQPLKRDLRLAAQIGVEVIVTPITTGIAGMVMLLFSVIFPFNPLAFSAIMAVTFGAWIWAALPTYHRYSETLVQALNRRRLDQSIVLVHDETTIAAMRRKLSSDYAGDVLFALSLLEKMEFKQIRAVLVDLLAHPAADVRRQALHRIEALGIRDALPAVEKLLAREQDPSVEAAAIGAWAALGPADSVSGRLSQLLSDTRTDVRRSAMIGVLRRDDGAGWATVDETIQALTNSTKVPDQVLAAQVIAEAGRASLLPRLSGLLRATEPEVRRAALLASGRNYHSELWPAIAENLTQRSTWNQATGAVVAAGERALPDLERWMDDPSLERLQLERGARIAGRIAGPFAIGILQKRLAHADPAVRLEVAKALASCGYRPSEEEAAGIRQLIRREVEDSVWKLAMLVDLGEDSDTQLLAFALQDENASARDRIFFLLSYLYSSKTILSAREKHAAGSKQQRAYALEALDLVLAREQREMLFPLFEDLPLNVRLEKLAADFPQVHRTRTERLGELLGASDGRIGSWARACALYATARLGEGSLEPEVRRWAEADAGPLISHTAKWAAARLGGQTTPSSEERHAMGMLAIERVMILKTVSIFAKTSEEILAEVAAILEELEFSAGQVIFEKGDPGDSMYIIIDGRVRVHIGEKVLTHLGAREIFGELAVLDPEPRSASITAVEDTFLFRLDRDAFFELIADNIEVVSGVFQVLCQRLRRATAVESANRK